MIYSNLCYVTHTKLPSESPRQVANTGILCYNGTIGKEQKEQNKLDFQGGNNQVLYTLCRALSKSQIFLRNFFIMENKLIAVPTVAELCGVCSRTIYRWIDSGVFPAPIVISKNKNGGSTGNRWIMQDVLNWIKGL